MTQGKVTVYGQDILARPLCDSEEAKLIVVRDATGAPNIVLARLNGDTWGLVTPEDKDWEAMCVRFGLLKPPSAVQILGGAH